MPFLEKKFNSFKLRTEDDKGNFILNTSRYNLLIFVDRLDFGDTAKNFIDIANGLVKRNVNVTILASSVRYRRQLDADVSVTTINIVKNKLMPFFVKVAQVERICKANKVDIILTNSADCAFIAMSVAKKMNIKFATYINDIWNVKDKFCKKQHEVMLKSDLMILPSLYACNYILDNYNWVNHKKMKLIRSGIDLNIFDIDAITKGRKVDAVKHLGDTTIGKRILLCPNKFYDKKGHIILLEAISRISNKEDKNFICVLMGDFLNTHEYRHRLVRLIKHFGIEKYVLLLNKFDDMPALYSLSYAVLSVSTGSEASTRIICEAGAMFRPAIITFVDGLNDYLVNERSGYVVYPNNIADISNAVERILQMTDEQYKRMCNFAHQYVLKYFDFKNTIVEIDNALSSLMK